MARFFLVSVLISASVERVSVSLMQLFVNVFMIQFYDCVRELAGKSLHCSIILQGKVCITP